MNQKLNVLNCMPVLGVLIIVLYKKKKNIRRSSAGDSGVLLTSWGMVGDLKAPTRFVENCAGRNSIGRPLRACIECIVVHKKKLAGPAWCRGDLSW